MKHRLFRKHRVILWESNGEIGIGKIVDATIKTNALETTLEVGEMALFTRNSMAKKGHDRKRVWLDHIITQEVTKTIEIPIKLMRIPTKVDRKIYKLYRK